MLSLSLFHTNRNKALEDFLTQNSTDFTVENGNVHLNPRRGYYDDIQETKEYFLYKLREYDGKPVLITDLFSNRHHGWISPETQYFSGNINLPTLSTLI